MTKHRDQIAFEQYVPEIYALWADVEKRIADAGFDPALNHLVKLRVSQMNGCAFCVKMHTSEARRDGETNLRLDRLIVWRHVKDFSDAEKAAFAWAEALTDLKPECDIAALRMSLLTYYSEADVSLLTSAISMINLWNRFAIAKH